MEQIVETKYGKVKGFEENGLLKYLGIPYAEQPIGAVSYTHLDVYKRQISP